MKRALYLIAVLAIVIAASSFSFTWFSRADRELIASGTLEARNINLGSKTGGRIVQVLVREGERVQPKQLLIVLDDAELTARLTQARGRVGQAQANLDKLVRGSRPEDIAEARAAALLGESDKGFRNAEVAQAHADLERAQADAVNAERNFQRIKRLVAKRAESREAYDDAEAKLRMAQAQVRSQQHAVAAAEGRLRAAKAVRERAEHGSRQEDIEAARAELTLAEGELREAEARLAEHEVHSPAAGVIEVMDLRPGDLVQPNAVLIKMLEPDQLYVMVYVPETRIGGVRLGQTAEVRVDAYPGETFTGKVEQIRQQAEFLPRNVQTPEERVHQVIGVKLRVDNTGNKLRAGTHADVKFLPVTD
jgi:multidrug resistance efflux pump